MSKSLNKRNTKQISDVAEPEMTIATVGALRAAGTVSCHVDARTATHPRVPKTAQACLIGQGRKEKQAKLTQKRATCYY